MIFRRSVSDANEPQGSDDAEPTSDAAAPVPGQPDEQGHAQEQPVVETTPDEPSVAEPAAADPDRVDATDPSSDPDLAETADPAADVGATAAASPEEDLDATSVRELIAVADPEPAAEPDPAADPEPEPAADPDATSVQEPSAAGRADDPDATSVRAAAVADPDATTVRAREGEETEVVAVGDDGTAQPPSTPPAPPRRRRRGRRTLLGIGIALVVLAAGYAGAAWYLGDKVPQSTTVAGVDISGQTAEEAETTLQTQLADLLVEPIPVTMGGATTTIDPAAAGLSLDAPATVAEFTGFTLDPRVVLGHLFGLGAREPVVVADGDALEAALTTAAGEVDLAPVDGVLEIVDGEAAVTTEPADGLSLDVDAAAAELPGQWLTGQRPLELASTVTTPSIDDDAIAAGRSELVEPLLSGPVTVELNDEEVELSPEQLASVAAISADGSTLVLTLDGDKLAEIVQKAAPSVGETPQDAEIVLKGGKPTIVPAVTGTGLDPEQLATVVTDAALATSADDRVATAELAQTDPDFSTEDAEELGVEEVVGEFDTPYPYDPTRTQNLINGTAHINGTLILPGDTFSLIEALGPITADNGYVSSHVVENGNVTDALGGGLSQVSTTTFNAAYEAGMEDIQHKPHSRWFDRYPPGREATMFAPDLDMQWGNNTPYGVLVQAWVDQDTSRVHVRLWSTAYWDVDITSSEKYNFTSPQTIYNERSECTPESAGPSGFSIDINRTVSHGGEVDDEYSGGYSWTYSPWNRIVCGPPPSEDDDDEESSSSSSD